VQPWDSKSDTLEQKIMCPIEDLGNSEHSFIFLMSGNEHLLYGVCVSQEELLCVCVLLALLE